MCAVCGGEVADQLGSGVGTMRFHPGCVPTCNFCGRSYDLAEHGWDFRGGVAWLDDRGYVNTVSAAYCPTCSDDAERRDYGLGW